MKNPRISFAEAISEPLLFQKQFYGDGTLQFPGLSIPQQVMLKVFYGLPLSGEELDHWAVFQESARFDELGYPISIDPISYTPREYSSAVAILGRRSGKTTQFMAFILAYEATLGGHLEFVAKKQEAATFLTAQKLEYAADFITQFVDPLIEDSPLLSKRIAKSNSDGMIIKSGIKGNSKTMGIRPAPPMIKSFRGPAIPVIAMDETAFWYKDAESANPDYEVERAVDKAMGQFPYKKKVVASTPWSKEGIVYDAYKAGTNGRKLENPAKRRKFIGTLVLHAPTPAVQNPLLTRTWFADEQAKDPEAYAREILAQFSESANGIFTEAQLLTAMGGQPTTIDTDEAADRVVLPREDHPEDPTPTYIAAMDPAFKRDAFAFGIFHAEGRRVVQDVKRKWKAEDPKHPLKPEDMLDCIKTLLDRYHINSVVSDQYQLESLQSLANEREFTIEGVTFTASSKVRMYGNLLVLLRQGLVDLLDDAETFNELLTVEKKLLPQGGVTISAPPNKHDDLASMVVLGTARASQMRTSEEETPKEAKSDKPTAHQMMMAELERRRRADGGGYDEDDFGEDPDEEDY